MSSKEQIQSMMDKWCTDEDPMVEEALHDTIEVQLKGYRSEMLIMMGKDPNEYYRLSESQRNALDTAAMAKWESKHNGNLPITEQLKWTDPEYVKTMLNVDENGNICATDPLTNINNERENPQQWNTLKPGESQSYNSDTNEINREKNQESDQQQQEQQQGQQEQEQQQGEQNQQQGEQQVQKNSIKENIEKEANAQRNNNNNNDIINQGKSAEDRINENIKKKNNDLSNRMEGVPYDQLSPSQKEVIDQISKEIVLGGKDLYSDLTKDELKKICDMKSGNPPYDNMDTTRPLSEYINMVDKPDDQIKLKFNSQLTYEETCNQSKITTLMRQLEPYKWQLTESGYKKLLEELDKEISFEYNEIGGIDTNSDDSIKKIQKAREIIEKYIDDWYDEEKISKENKSIYEEIARIKKEIEKAKSEGKNTNELEEYLANLYQILNNEMDKFYQKIGKFPNICVIRGNNNNYVYCNHLVELYKKAAEKSFNKSENTLNLNDTWQEFIKSLKQENDNANNDIGGQYDPTTPTNNYIVNFNPYFHKNYCGEDYYKMWERMESEGKQDTSDCWNSILECLKGINKDIIDPNNAPNGKADTIGFSPEKLDEVMEENNNNLIKSLEIILESGKDFKKYSPEPPQTDITERSEKKWPGQDLPLENIYFGLPPIFNCLENIESQTTGVHSEIDLFQKAMLLNSFPVLSLTPINVERPVNLQGIKQIVYEPITYKFIVLNEGGFDYSIRNEYGASEAERYFTETTEFDSLRETLQFAKVSSSFKEILSGADKMMNENFNKLWEGFKGNLSTLNDSFQSVTNLNSTGRGSDRILSGLENIAHAAFKSMLMGSKIDIPDIWKASSGTPNQNLRIRLHCPYPQDDELYERLITLPLKILFRLGLPYSTTSKSNDNSRTGADGNSYDTNDIITYENPPYIKASVDGVFYTNIGAITSLNISGEFKNQSYVKAGRPMIVDVDLTISDLYNVIIWEDGENTEGEGSARDWGPTGNQIADRMKKTERDFYSRQFKDDSNILDPAYTHLLPKGSVSVHTNEDINTKISININNFDAEINKFKNEFIERVKKENPNATTINIKLPLPNSTGLNIEYENIKVHNINLEGLTVDKLREIYNEEGIQYNQNISSNQFNKELNNFIINKLGINEGIRGIKDESLRDQLSMLSMLLESKIVNMNQVSQLLNANTKQAENVVWN